MRARDLVTAWERGHDLTPAGRGLALLDWLQPAADDPGALTVGQRDALLLDLRRELFGPCVSAVAPCPACGERLELAFDVDDVRTQPPADPAAPLEVTRDGYRVRARPPTTTDVTALDAVPPGHDPRTVLLHRCVLDARRDGATIAVDGLPDGVVADVVAGLGAADPQADVQLRLACASCGHEWSAVFDIVTYLWDELESAGRRLVLEVHALASAYGWSEADVLAMSPWRRGLYLEQVRG